jgi:ubiquinone/menaquinone biosynthesis C-methylase UbiE
LTEEDNKTLAAQLRKPHGDIGKEVASFMNKRNETLNRNTIDQISKKSNLNVVELGMGNGKFVPELLNKHDVERYFGCDYAPEMVNAATELNKKHVTSGKVLFHECEATQLPFQSLSIDVIFSVNTIYFWEDSHNVLQEFRRVLSKGGELIIGLRPKHLMEHYPFVKYRFNMFTAQDVIQRMEENGFQHCESQTFQEPDFVTEEITFPVQSLVVKGISN